MDDGNGEPIFAATEQLSSRVTVKLHAESILTNPKSILTDAENAIKLNLVDVWIGTRLDGIRVDARQNMRNVLHVVGIDQNLSQEQIAAVCAMSTIGIKKVMSALQKMGMLIREGGDFGGKWKLVGFENGG